MVEIQHVADAEGLSRAAAGLFARLARRAVAHRRRFTVALSGGSTPRGVYERLAGASLRDGIPWDRIEFFWGDERPLPPDHPDSNYRMAWESFLSSVPVTAEQIHRMKAERTDLDRAAIEYELEIGRVFGISRSASPPSFDLVLLGMGSDGHTASLFPGTPALSSGDRWVVDNPVPGQSTRRMTLTLPVLNQARHVCFLVGGEAKARTLAKVLEGPHSPEVLPSQAVGPTAGRVVWIVDRAAAAKLRGFDTLRPLLASSILAADFARLGEQVTDVEEAGVDRFHVDVMDGHFVPNISIGPGVVRSLRRITRLPLETHLMVTNPGDFLEAFAEAGSDSIIFHCEATSNLNELITRIRDLGMGVGITLRPGTPAEAVEPFLKDVDLVLVMTVEPGFGGQRFLADTLRKVSQLRGAIDRVNPTCELEVDGGIDVETAPQALRAGAGVFVAGSAIFAAKVDVAAATARLQSSLSGDSSAQSLISGTRNSVVKESA